MIWVVICELCVSFGPNRFSLKLEIWIWTKLNNNILVIKQIQKHQSEEREKRTQKVDLSTIFIFPDS